MSKFKVGDKVRVIPRTKYARESLAHLDEKVGIIDHFDRSDNELPYLVEFPEGEEEEHSEYWLNGRDLKKEMKQ